MCRCGSCGCAALSWERGNDQSEHHARPRRASATAPLRTGADMGLLKLGEERACDRDPYDELGPVEPQRHVSDGAVASILGRPEVCAVGVDDEEAQQSIPRHPDKGIDERLDHTTGAEAAWICQQIRVKKELAADDDQDDDSAAARGLRHMAVLFCLAGPCRHSAAG